MARLRRQAGDRRKAIIEATGAVLLRRGLAAATTREVAAELGVGAGLLNHYFTWSQLRALALGDVLARDLDGLMPAEGKSPAPAQTLSRFIDGAFAAQAEPIWRLWIEAIETAVSDAAVADVITAAARRLHLTLAAVIAAGHDAGDWRCPDANGAATRILAAHDGLVGFVISGVLLVDRSAARSHLTAVVALECAGYRPRPSPHPQSTASSA
jgi:AcrR family transcriptional regulator